MEVAKTSAGRRVHLAAVLAPVQCVLRDKLRALGSAQIVLFIPMIVHMLEGRQPATPMPSLNASIERELRAQDLTVVAETALIIEYKTAILVGSVKLVISVPLIELIAGGQLARAAILLANAHKGR